MGPGAGRIAGMLFLRAREAGVAAAVAPAAVDVGRLAASGEGTILAQHVDALPAGARTGYQIPEGLVATGARGSLVNHSEHPLSGSEVARVVDRLGQLGLVAVVCAGTLARVRTLAALRPPYLALEPPELIGGAVSVAESRPGLISNAAVAVSRLSPTTTLLCGAGVRDRRDVSRALELGAGGILVASAVATSRDPGRAIDELLAGM